MLKLPDGIQASGDESRSKHPGVGGPTIIWAQHTVDEKTPAPLKVFFRGLWVETQVPYFSHHEIDWISGCSP